MARYFSDYDDGETKYVDTIGTELASLEQVPDEGIGLLATMFRYQSPEGQPNSHCEHSG